MTHSISINFADKVPITNEEITEIIIQAYLNEGYIRADEVVTIFTPSLIRQRGTIISARESVTRELAGMVILVPPESSAKRIAKENEAEIHLLGVKSVYRGRGIAQQLMETVITLAKQAGYPTLVLITQQNMHIAQRLYEKLGFVHVSDIARNGREYKHYEKDLGVHQGE